MRSLRHAAHHRTKATHMINLGYVALSPDLTVTVWPRPTQQTRNRPLSIRLVSAVNFGSIVE